MHRTALALRPQVCRLEAEGNTSQAGQQHNPRGVAEPTSCPVVSATRSTDTIGLSVLDAELSSQEADDLGIELPMKG